MPIDLDFDNNRHHDNDDIGFDENLKNGLYGGLNDNNNNNSLLYMQPITEQKNLNDLPNETQKLLDMTKSLGNTLNATLTGALIMNQIKRQQEKITQDTQFKLALDTQGDYMRKIAEMADKSSVNYALNDFNARHQQLSKQVEALQTMGPVNVDVVGNLLKSYNDLLDEVKVYNETVTKSAKEIEKSKQYMTSLVDVKSKVVNLASVNVISNYSIFELFSFEMQKKYTSEDVQLSWANMELDFVKIFKQYPMLNRVADGKLVLVKPSDNKPAVLVAKVEHGMVFADMTENFSTTSQAVYDSIDRTSRVALEEAVGKLLNKFYVFNSKELFSKQTQIFSRFCPPFTHHYEIEESILKRAFLPPKMNDDIHFNLSAAGQVEDEILCVTPNYILTANGNTLSVSPASGGVCCRPARGQLMTNLRASGGGTLFGDVPTVDLFSLYGGKNKKKRNIVSRNNRAIKKNKRTGPVIVEEPDDSSASSTAQSSEEDDDDDDNNEMTRPVVASSSSSSKNQILRKSNLGDKVTAQALSSLVSIKNQLNQLLSKQTTGNFEAFIKSIINVGQAVRNVKLAENPSVQSSKHLITRKQIVELLRGVDNLIVKNNGAPDVQKKLLNQSIDLCSEIANVMEMDIPNPKPYYIYLVKDDRTVGEVVVLKAFDELRTSLDAIADAIFSATKYENPYTGFTVGKFNRSMQEFELSDEGREISLESNARTQKALDEFKKKYLARDYYVNVITKLKNADTTLTQNINNLQQAYAWMFDPVNNVAGNFLEFVKSFIGKDPCSDLSTLFTVSDAENLTVDERGGVFKRYNNTQTALVEWIQEQQKKKQPPGEINLFNFVSSANYKPELIQDPMLICYWDTLAGGRDFPYYGNNSKPDQPKNGESFMQKCKEIILLLKSLPQQELKLNMTNPPFVTLDTSELKQTIKEYERHLQLIDQLNVKHFVKSFNTPIENHADNIVDTFVKGGHNLVLQRAHNFSIYFIGPSGAGKSYSQYGLPSNAQNPSGVLGLDSLFLSMPRLSLTFKDYYSLCFFAADSFFYAIRQPQVINYSFDQNKNIVASVGDKSTQSTPITTLNISNYKDIIDDERKKMNMIVSTTENPGGSSRAFFVTQIKQEGNITKELVDTPGREPINNPALTNPFLFIYHFISLYTKVDLKKYYLQSDDKNGTQPCFKQWIVEAANQLHTKIKEFSILPEPEHTVDWLITGLDTKIPQPHGVSFNTHGLEPGLSFQALVDDTYLFIGNKIVHDNVDKTYYGGDKSKAKNTTLDDLNIDLILNQHEMHEGIVLSPSLPEIKFRKVIKTPLKQSNTSLKLGETSRHNMCLEKKTAMKLFWTWRIFEKIFITSKLAKNGTPLAKIVQDYFMRIVPEEYHKDMRIALEATFINQFNNWVATATMLKGNQNLANYMNPQKQASRVVSFGDLFYEFMLVATDIRYVRPENTNRRFAVDGIAKKLDWQLTLEPQNQSSVGFRLTANYLTNAMAQKFALKEAIDAYNELLGSIHHLDSYTIGNSDEFNTNFLGSVANHKNYIVTMWASDKFSKYFQFFDIRHVENNNSSTTLNSDDTTPMDTAP